MPTRERPIDRGNRIARADLVRVGAELREARVGAGLSLADVGRAAGLSPSQVSRLERARLPSAGVRRLASVGAAVGLDVRIRAYKAGDPIRDLAHVRLLDRLRPRLGEGLTFRTEVPLPDPDDQRAWDGWIGGIRAPVPTLRSMPVEAETRVADAQAVMRKLALKLRDGGVDHLLLIVADTRANRDAIAAAGMAVRELFPISPRRALRALAAGRHPGGSALVFL
jgi:transcriptional regulator with XRE-family HTH domain